MLNAVVEPRQGVFVTYASMAMLLQELPPAMEFLSDLEQKLFDAGRISVRSKQQFLVGRWLCKQLVRQVLGGVASDWQVLSAVNGAPVLQDSRGVVIGAVSLSHSQSLVAVILSLQSNAVGIDIECMKERKQPREVLSLICQAHEAAWYDEQPSLKRFYMMWAAKEACAKAHQMSIWEMKYVDVLSLFRNENEQNRAQLAELRFFQDETDRYMGAWVNC